MFDRNINNLVIDLKKHFGNNNEKVNEVVKSISTIIADIKTQIDTGVSRIAATTNDYGPTKLINVKDAAKISTVCLKKKYENQYLVITGRKKIKISRLLKILKNFFKINAPIIYGKIKLPGHYVNTPHTYKWNGGLTLKPSRGLAFEKDIIQNLKNKTFLK